MANMANNSIAGAFKALAGHGKLRFQYQGVIPTGSFIINSTTGVIRTAAKLDRENLSLFDDKFQIQVKISVGQISAVIPTEIKVLDVNDNSPAFAESVEHIAVSESAPLGVASFTAVFRLVPPHKRLLNGAIHSFPGFSQSHFTYYIPVG